MVGKNGMPLVFGRAGTIFFNQSRPSSVSKLSSAVLSVLLLVYQFL